MHISECTLFEREFAMKTSLFWNSLLPLGWLEPEYIDLWGTLQSLTIFPRFF